MSAMFGIVPEGDEGARSSRRLRRLKRRLRQRPEGELNIVSMIDVFAVLVFFLLVGSSISASKLHALKLSLPSLAEPSMGSDEPSLTLAVSLFADNLVITSRTGFRKSLPKIDDAYDTAGLSQSLVGIKANHPDESRVALFVAEEVAYADIVAVMDSVREYPSGVVGADGARALFPLISMGDAAVAAAVESGVRP
ncbi:ExbD/TolR family protein [Zhongshania sp.]|uniref:ExbD/TolR family protein n=1 Tax=Zhongshania sp. TaxID=1971902 RepID=UPI0035624020